MPLTNLTPDEARSWLRLAFTPGVPLSAQRKLLKAFGSPQAALAAVDQDERLRDSAVAEALRKAKGAPAEDEALAWLELPGHHLVVLGDPGYPPQLLQIHDPPTALFVRGNPAWLRAPAIAVVGSRNATPQGRRDAHAFARELSESGLTIVSGLALGIDAAAHGGGLRAAGSSVAVMGTGPDSTYPKSNLPLAQELEARGCLVTEFPLGMPQQRWNFPRRNRLISGLALGVLVVEAARDSGSLITARCALDQGREVFAIPGSIHAPMSKGCHHLVKEGAKLVECANDVLEELGFPTVGEAMEEAGSQPPETDSFLNAVRYAPTSIDEIADATGLEAGEIAQRLTRLELAGRLDVHPGGRYSLREAGTRKPRYRMKAETLIETQ